jgi:putative ABC transport system substrate-binding protein
MRRREFLGALGGAVAAWPLKARAQQPAMPVVGILSSTSAAPYKSFVEAVIRGLREEGFDLGRNVAVEQRWADGQYDRLPAFASELIHLRANVIIAIAPPAARAAKAAASSIPIVFSTAGDPVALGLVSSLNRPGGNLTGVNLQLFALAGKRIELLTKVAPTANVIGLLMNPNNPSSKSSTADAQAAAEALGKKLIVGSGGTAADIETSFAHFVQHKVDAIAVEPDPFMLARRDRLAAQAARHSLPAIYPHRENVEAGGLISYGTDLVDAYRQIGLYAGRVLKGEQPANLPIMQVTKFELLINMKTAKTLGITVPPTLLAIADEVIE